MNFSYFHFKDMELIQGNLSSQVSLHGHESCCSPFAIEMWGGFIGVKWPSPAEFIETSKSHSDTEHGLGLEWKRRESLFLSLISAALL